MCGSKAVHSSYFLRVVLIVVCFTGVLLAQTFHYSRGWTNGRKRAPLPFTMDHRREEPENIGNCGMQKLKHLLEHKYRTEANLPCGMCDGIDYDSDRFDRNGDTFSVSDPLPIRKN